MTPDVFIMSILPMKPGDIFLTITIYSIFLNFSIHLLFRDMFFDGLKIISDTVSKVSCSSSNFIYSLLLWMHQNRITSQQQHHTQSPNIIFLVHSLTPPIVTVYSSGSIPRCIRIHLLKPTDEIWTEGWYSFFHHHRRLHHEHNQIVNFLNFARRKYIVHLLPGCDHLVGLQSLYEWPCFLTMVRRFSDNSYIRNRNKLRAAKPLLMMHFIPYTDCNTSLKHISLEYFGNFGACQFCIGDH